MKMTFFISIIFMLFFALTGCKKEGAIFDPCKNKTCLNGGFCKSGKCQCPTYYTGENCEIDNRPACMKEHQGTVSLSNATNHTLRFYFDGRYIDQISSGQSTTFEYKVGTYTYYSQYWLGALGVGQWVNNAPGTLTVTECNEAYGGYH